MSQQIKNKIAELPPNKQLLFGISCVKRMQIYLEKYLINKGDVLNSLKLNKLIEDVFLDYSLNKFNAIDKYINVEDVEFIEELIPDTNDDGGYEAVLAQNAGIALAYCLDFIEKNDTEFINYCSTKAFESVDVIAFEVLNLDSSDQLISQELEVQNKIIDAIISMNNNFKTTDISQLELFIEKFKIET